MNKRTIVTLLLIHGLTLFSCSLIDIQPPGNIETIPREDGEIIDAGSPVKIIFPFLPEKGSAESLLRVTNFEGVIPGEKVWENTSLLFYPRDPPPPGIRCRVELSGNYRDPEGKSHRANKRISFFWGGDTYTANETTVIYPPRGGEISVHESVRLSFSSSVDPRQFDGEFTITPSAGYRVEWSENHKEALIYPEDQWEVDKLYTLKGLPPRGEGETHFWVREEEHPRILRTGRAENSRDLNFPIISETLEDIAPGEIISVQFTLPMNSDTAEQSFSLEPEIRGKFIWPEKERLLFVPEELFRNTTIHTLRIRRTASCESGRFMKEDFIHTFTPDNPFFALLSVGGRPEDGFPLLPPFSTDLPGELSFPPTPRDYTLQFEFSGPFSSDYLKEKAQSSIVLEKIFPSSGFGPVVTGMNWINDTLLSVTWSGFPEPEAGSFHYYTVTIPGGPEGIISSGGRRLEDTIILFFKV